MIASAFAHVVGDAHEAAGWSAWTFDPFVLFLLVLVAWLYGRGVRDAWQRAGAGRGVSQWQVRSFAAGLSALFLALVWPLDALGEHLFSAHMAQHLVLMNVAAPFLVLGTPLGPMLRALPRTWQRRLGAAAQTRGWRTGWRWLTGLAAATVLQQIVMWCWHTPAAIAGALENDFVHVAMHVSLLVVALLFWTAVFRRDAQAPWSAVIALFVTFKASGLPCIILLTGERALYTAYGASATAWGLTPQQDEQIGWGLMMVLGAATYLLPAVALLALGFARLEAKHPSLPLRADDGA
jgi:putative membrane protein